MDVTMPLPVTETSSAELERAVAVIALAFTADPAFRWIFPDPDRYLRYFPAFVRVLAATAVEHGTAFQAGDCTAAALWLPPLATPDRSAMSAIMREGVATDRHAEFFTYAERMASHRPSEPYWWLPFIGVDPLHRHQGLGSALLRHALLRCDRDHMPAHLETSNPANLPLYERHGFESLGSFQVGSSPIVFPMRRAPR
jgi:GNAT superfamily N-acetyltransferase